MNYIKKNNNSEIYNGFYKVFDGFIIIERRFNNSVRYVDASQTKSFV